MKRAGILFADFGPYHVARIEALREALGQDGAELVAFRFTERSDEYGWKPEDPRGVPVVTLSRSKPRIAWEAFKVSAIFSRELRRRNVDVVFLPSFYPLPNLFCLLAAKLSGCRTVLMTDSWHGTQSASLRAKLIKHALVRMFDAALVGGSPHRDYVVAYGMPRERVFVGYDVVDVQHFAKRAEKFRAVQKRAQGPGNGDQETSGVASFLQTEHALIRSLPERFFLNLGRFVEKKNLATLVSAYAKFCGESRKQEASVTPRSSVALVLVGEGPLGRELEWQSRELGLVVRDGVVDPNPSGGAEVVFYPFQQVDVTPLFFARCEAFVLPSTHEEWGLVVNEAMACGAPVIVANRVGSHFDLVKEGVNGFTFDPDNVDNLVNLLSRFDVDEDLSGRLGSAGQRLIEEWKPARFAQGALDALRASFPCN